MSEYADGDYLLVIDKKGRLYYKEQLSFFGDSHLAISLFIKHSKNVDLNIKLKKRISTGV
jgi:hypothetical protein